jgi:hypothetical protein
MVHNPYPTKRRRRKDLRPRVKIGEQFIAHPVAMLKSAAFRSLKLAERKILDRLEIEHARHGGKRNGDLVCTYTDFRKHGVRKASISDAIKQLVRRGLIEITKQGRPSYGDLRNPSHYRLTYLSTFQNEVWTDATHEWRCLEKQKARYENVPGARHENVPGKANFPGTKTGLKPKKPGTKMGLLSRSTGRRGGGMRDGESIYPTEQPPPTFSPGDQWHQEKKEAEASIERYRREGELLARPPESKQEEFDIHASDSNPPASLNPPPSPASARSPSAPAGGRRRKDDSGPLPRWTDVWPTTGEAANDPPHALGQDHQSARQANPRTPARGGSAVTRPCLEMARGG